MMAMDISDVVITNPTCDCGRHAPYAVDRGYLTADGQD